MRSRTPLALMEQAVMLLVFVLAALLCVRVFVRGDLSSKESAAADRALLEAKNTIEQLKAEGMEEDFCILYNEDWEIVGKDSPYVYELTVSSVETGSPYLWKVRAEVTDGKGNLLVSLPAAGQREAGDAS